MKQDFEAGLWIGFLAGAFFVLGFSLFNSLVSFFPYCKQNMTSGLCRMPFFVLVSGLGIIGYKLFNKKYLFDNLITNNGDYYREKNIPIKEQRRYR